MNNDDLRDIIIHQEEADAAEKEALVQWKAQEAMKEAEEKA